MRSLCEKMAVSDVKERTVDRDTEADRQRKEVNKYQRLLKKYENNFNDSNHTAQFARFIELNLN